MELNQFFKQLDNDSQDDAATPLERLLLYALVRNIKPKVCVEIGTHRGLSTIAIAQALKDNGEGVVHTIDPKNWEHHFDSYGVQDYVVYHQEYSLNFDPPENIDFIFFDGEHEYEVVRKEIERYLPKLSPHGVAVFHDCAGDGMTVGSNQAVIDEGLESAFIPTGNCLRIYGKMFNPPYGRNYMQDNGLYSLDKASGNPIHPRVIKETNI